MNTLYSQIKLLEDYSFCAFKAPYDVASAKFSEWMNEVLAPEIIQTNQLTGTLKILLNCLDPTPLPVIKNSLFIATKTGWTILIENGLFGTDNGRASVLSGKCACEAIYANFQKQGAALYERSTNKVVYGGAVLSVYQNGARRRIIECANDGGKWALREEGTPYDFEDVASYTKKPVSARFTTDMLKAYLLNLGLDLGNDNWYLTKNNQVNGILVSRK
jgi:hypothetical protein